MQELSGTVSFGESVSFINNENVFWRDATQDDGKSVGSVCGTQRDVTIGTFDFTGMYTADVNIPIINRIEESSNYLSVEESQNYNTYTSSKNVDFFNFLGYVNYTSLFNSKIEQFNNCSKVTNSNTLDISDIDVYNIYTSSTNKDYIANNWFSSEMRIGMFIEN